MATIITTIGHAKLSTAALAGEDLLLHSMALGDGEGAITPDMTALLSEIYRGELNSLERDPADPGRLTAALEIPVEVGGFTIREMGLFDADGDLISVGSCRDLDKPLPENGGFALTLRMLLVVSTEARITLAVSPNTPLLPSPFGRELLLAADSDQAKKLLEVAMSGNSLVFCPAGNWASLIPENAEVENEENIFLISAPPYAVGSGQLKVYLSGLRCQAGDNPDQHTYREIGTPGEISTLIAFYDVSEVQQYDLLMEA